MASDNGILVPINYKGQWRKGVDECWTYDALFTRYVRVKGTTTYHELIDMICAEMGISRNGNIIEVHAWVSYPIKEMLPPFIMLRDEDISTFIELNAKREFVIPLCISTSEKPKDVVPPHQPDPVISDKPKVHVVPNHQVSNSVNQPERISHAGEDNMDLFGMIGLEDIKFTNPDDDFICGDSVQEQESSNDAFDYDDPFNYDEDDDCYQRPDPFEFAVDGLYETFLDFLRSINDVDKQASPISKHASPTPDLDHVHHNPFPKPSATIPSVRKGKDISGSMCRNTACSDAQSTNVHVLKDFTVGEILKSKAELMIRLRVICLKANREFRVTHSNTSRIIVRCVDKSCKWRLRGSWNANNGWWVIGNYLKVHSCSIDARVKRCRGTATSTAIAHMVKEDRNKPGDIMEMLQRVYGIKISYWKAWKAKEIATQLVRGMPELSFMGLPSYFWLLEQANPGTISAYLLDGENQFEQCFLAFGPSVIGFRSCIRPVIAVDACFLKGRYKGKLFIATCMDGNNQIYPLAFGVAATENDLSWTWFFKNLRGVVGCRDDLVFISDRHPSIEKCCLKEFPEAVYGICMFHLGLNMQAKYKVKAKDFLYGVAKSYTEFDFEEKFQHILSMKKPVYDYLMDADPSKWARCFFPSRRYSIMTTNIAESMNALLKEAREFPIIGMLETIRTILQGWFHDRLQNANKCTSTLTPYAERKVGKRDDKSRHFKIYPIDEFRFYVKDGRRDATVDINVRSCTCNKFQLNQLPCAHATRACRDRSVSVYSLCSRFYTLESLRMSYSIPLNPVPHRSEWSRLVPPCVQSVIVKPPVVTIKKGRRKNKRMPSQGEEVVRKRCGRCRGWGHNKQTCTGNEYVPVHQHDKV